MNSTYNRYYNDSLLSNYDIIIVEECGSSWIRHKLTDLGNWVLKGGTLFAIGNN